MGGHTEGWRSEEESDRNGGLGRLIWKQEGQDQIWDDAQKKDSEDVLHLLQEANESPLWGVGNPSAGGEVKCRRPDESRIAFV